MSDSQADLETIKADFLAFIQGAHSCTLATTSPEGWPEASYVTGFGKAYELQGEQLQKISHINR